MRMIILELWCFTYGLGMKAIYVSMAILIIGLALKLQREGELW